LSDIAKFLIHEQNNNLRIHNIARIGSRHYKMCAQITMCDGGELPWVDEIRYLGVVIIRGTKFKCPIVLPLW